MSVTRMVRDQLKIDRNDRRRVHRLNAREVRRESRLGLTRPIVARPDRLKPKQPTIIRRGTLDRLMYLEKIGLAHGELVIDCVMPKTHFRHLDIMGKPESVKIDDRSLTYASA